MSNADSVSDSSPRFTERERPTRWERLHPIRARRLRRCVTAGTHAPVLIDLGRSKLCMTCYEWTREGR